MTLQEKALAFLQKTESANSDLLNYAQSMAPAAEASLPLEKLVRTVGPERHQLNPEDVTKFEERIARLMNDIQSGTRPFPLLAEYDGDTFVLIDGNHTYEALKRTGYTEYPVIYWNRNEVHRAMRSGQ